MLISFHTASEATILPKGTVQFQCNLVHLHNFVANAASEAAMKKETVQFQCDLAHEVNFLYRGLRSSHSEKRELCSFSATLCTWIISLPLCSLSPARQCGQLQIRRHPAQMRNFIAHSGNCAISLPPRAVGQFHCQGRRPPCAVRQRCNSNATPYNFAISLPMRAKRFRRHPVRLRNFIANSGNSVISLPPCASVQFHCQGQRPPVAVRQRCNFNATSYNCAISLPMQATHQFRRQWCNFSATSYNCAISLPSRATQQFRCHPVQLCNFIANRGIGAISLPPCADGQFHCQGRRPPRAV